jgi:hypothetical protein
MASSADLRENLLETHPTLDCMFFLSARSDFLCAPSFRAAFGQLKPALL